MTAVIFKFFLKPSQESAACNRIPPGSDTRSLTICFNECLTLRATYSRAIFFFPSLATTIDGRRNRESKDDLMACLGHVALPGRFDKWKILRVLSQKSSNL